MTPEEFLTPGRGGFRLFGDFQHGEYKLSMHAGLKTVNGGALPNLYETQFEIPERSPSVGFVSQGRYLPRDAWQLLPDERESNLIYQESLPLSGSDDTETSSSRKNQYQMASKASLTASGLCPMTLRRIRAA